MVAEQLPSHQRREELLRLIKDLGLWNLHYPTLASKYGVSHQQISKDIHKILRSVQPESVDRIGQIIEFSYQKSMKECQKLQNHESPLIRLHAVRASNDTNQKYKDFLENWGRKEKIADKIEHQGGISIIAPDWWIECNKVNKPLSSKDTNQQASNSTSTKAKQSSDSSAQE